MLHARTRVHRLLLAFGLTLALLAGPASAGMDSLAVAPTQADAALTPLALGFDLWLGAQLETAGLAGTQIDAGTDLPSALGNAAAHGFAHVLVPQISARGGEATVRLLLYAPDSHTLLVGARERAPLAEIGNAVIAVLDRVLPQLGGSNQLDITPPLIEDLASSSQSVLARRAGDLPRAFRAVQGKLTPTAMALREEIVREARQSTTPATIRARVLNAVGDPVTAWGLIGHTARAELGKPEPDVDLLVAAGEVMISQGAVAQARKYLDRALEVAPDHLDASGALAELFDLEGNSDQARAHLLRAARIDAKSPHFPEQLARIEPDAGAAAKHWLEAGRRSSRHLDAQRARTQFDEAANLHPELAAAVGAEVGALEERLGRPGKAMLAYRRAVQGGVKTPVVLTALGRNEHRTGATKQAEKTLRGALQVDPKHPGALRELGVVFAETGRTDEALPVLKQANQIEPGDSRGRITLSRALRATGDPDEALALLQTKVGEAPAQELFEVASIQVEVGDLEAARESLAQAVHLEPADPQLRNQFADVLEQLGDDAAALAQREFAAALDPNQEGGAKPSEIASVLSLDDLVMSFAVQVASPHTRSVTLLGVREPTDWKTRVLQVLRPRSPDLEAIERGLRSAIAARFDPTGAATETDPALSLHVDQLFDYESDLSLNADTIATLNQVSALDGVFTTRLLAHPTLSNLGGEAEQTCAAGNFAVEMRLLMGRDPETASILSNLDCLRGGLDVYGKWNVVALSIYGAFALLLLWPMLRGWGQIVVQIRLPERTKGFFSIHITKRPDQVKREVSDKTKREKSKGSRFDFMMRYQRHMAGPETIFRLIPARRQHYTVTVSGPLMDARGEEIIGHFLEEQRVTVRRRRAGTLVFDFRPKEVAVEVTIRQNGRPAPSARVGVQGDPSSLRYARDGVAYLYLGLGSYTVLVGSHDSAASFDLEISSLDSAIPLEVDMGRGEGLVFQECPDAVEPYLQSDLSTAARALDNAGNARAAHLLRADLYRQQGRSEEAARELEAAGEIGGAAEMRTSGDDFEGGAALYEEAGEIDQAAHAYREAGRFAEAARCYEQAYDYGNALECWREAGDSEHEMLMLGKLGEYMEAAQIAQELGQRERIIEYLQHIEPRHPQFGDACRMLAEIASEDGDHDLAVAKFEEALSSTGVEAASIETLESYAAVLERAGRTREAVSAYEAIRRQDVGRTDIATRIQTLKQEITQLEVQTQVVTTAAAAAPTESRYELLEEIGRGGMGVVYKARDKRLGRVVALKRLPENLRDHPAAVQLFEREARAAASLNHVNIVTIFDADEENGSYFITMELLEGRPLNEILERNGRVSVADTMRLGIQMCAGLAYAHDRRIVHRDIKTANLFFTKEQVVKIMDFGIAKSLEEVRRSTTVLGGTPYYMAPEQSSGEGVDHRADLYALGVTLFQLATGQLPFNDGDVAYRHRHEDPPDPRELNLNLPAALAELILQLMAKSPEDRPANAGTVGARLGELLGKL